MKASSALLGRLSRCRFLASGFLGALGCVLLCAGFGLTELLPLPGVAVADSAPADAHGIPIAAMSSEKAALLQSTVDSTALTLSGALATAPASSSRERLSIVGGALSSLTFRLGSEVYFTAWQGTRIVHSPLAPDAAHMDFAHALDERGAAFVQRMDDIAGSGGGFLRVTLPRQMTANAAFANQPLAVNKDDSLITREIDALASQIEGFCGDHQQGDATEPVCFDGACLLSPAHGSEVSAIASAPILPPSSSPQSMLQDPSPTPLFSASSSMVSGSSAAVDQVVYVRQIPQSDWYIAAFMPVEASPAPEGFSAAWTRTPDQEALLEDRLRRGLCVSGFSLAGLSCLLVTPGRRRPQDGPSEATPRDDSPA